MKTLESLKEAGNVKNSAAAKLDRLTEELLNEVRLALASGETQIRRRIVAITCKLDRMLAEVMP